MAAEAAARASLEEAGAERERATAVRSQIDAKVEQLTKLQEETAEAKAQELALKGLMAQHEQTLEGARVLRHRRQTHALTSTSTAAKSAHATSCHVGPLRAPAYSTPALCALPADLPALKPAESHGLSHTG